MYLFSQILLGISILSLQRPLRLREGDLPKVTSPGRSRVLILPPRHSCSSFASDTRYCKQRHNVTETLNAASSGSKRNHLQPLHSPRLFRSVRVLRSRKWHKTNQGKIGPSCLWHLLMNRALSQSLDCFITGL